MGIETITVEQLSFSFLWPQEQLPLSKVMQTYQTANEGMAGKKLETAVLESLTGIQPLPELSARSLAGW